MQKNRGLKIAFVSTYFPPFFGGEGMNAYYLARELAKKHDVHVFTSDRKDKIKLKKEEIMNGIKVHRCKVWFRIGYHFVFYPSLTSKILKENFDIIHFCSFGILQHDLTLILKKLSRKFSGKRTIFFNTPAHQSFAHGIRGKIAEFFIRNIEKFFNKLYDIVIEISPGQEKWMQKWGIERKKIKLVTPGISEENFKKYNVENLVKKFNFKNKFIISYVGRIQEYKGLDQVIRILPDLLKINKNIIFLCIGKDAGDKARLQEMVKKLSIEKKVIFADELEEKEKIALLSISEIFILPSKIEGFGIVLLEAMAQGIPVISTKTDGGKFLIDSSCGFLYNFDDLKKLKEIMEKMIKNKSLRKKLGRNCKKKAISFLWGDIAKNLEKIYLEELEIKKQ